MLQPTDWESVQVMFSLFVISGNNDILGVLCSYVVRRSDLSLLLKHVTSARLCTSTVRKHLNILHITMYCTPVLVLSFMYKYELEAFGSLIIGVLGYDIGTCQSRWLIFQLTLVL